jgi:hypothetical protein
MFAGQMVKFLPLVSEGVGEEKNLLWPPVSFMGYGLLPSLHLSCDILNKWFRIFFYSLFVKPLSYICVHPKVPLRRMQDEFSMTSKLYDMQSRTTIVFHSLFKTSVFLSYYSWCSNWPPSWVVHARQQTPSQGLSQRPRPSFLNVTLLH